MFFHRGQIGFPSRPSRRVECVARPVHNEALRAGCVAIPVNERDFLRAGEHGQRAQQIGKRRFVWTDSGYEFRRQHGRLTSETDSLAIAYNVRALAPDEVQQLVRVHNSTSTVRGCIPMSPMSLLSPFRDTGDTGDIGDTRDTGDTREGRECV